MRPPTSYFFNRQGVALPIVLAFVVILVVVVTAVFSRALIDRQISNASAGQTKADVLARGAADDIVAKVQQEIATNSNTVTGLPTGVTVYRPKTPQNMVPKRPAAIVAPATAPNGLENLVTYSGAGTLSENASAVTTDKAAVDGRFLSTTVWNRPLLIQKANLAGTDPRPVAAFPIPQWILIPRRGSPPTSAAAAGDRTQDTYVSGRYAYTIYNEGGILDVNVAGYPSTAGTGPLVNVPAYKGSLAYADLTKLTVAGQNVLTQDQVNQLVAWRNFASAGTNFTTRPPSASGSPLNWDFPGSLASWPLPNFNNYVSSISANGNGFLKVTSPVTISGKTDRKFISRQQLISFLTSGLSKDPTGTNAASATLQNALLYLGTFSRALDQPSYSPDPNRPKTATYSGSDPAVTGTFGTNSGGGGDDQINPSFLSVRVTGAFPRTDNSTANIDEPLVKKRFLLKRLAWLTYQGPITLNGTSYNPNVPAALISVLKNSYGYTDDFLLQGTPGNIYKYFGLSWVSAALYDEGSAQSRWVYSHANVSGPLSAIPGSGAIIKTLSQLGNLREPDFFELLKAGLICGSKAKTATAQASGVVSVDFWQNKRDSSLDFAVIQIGANIIDQGDLDGYPTRIVFNDGTTVQKEFRGVENLPYIYSSFPVIVQVRSGAASGGNITDTGVNLLMRQVSLWNPHDQTCPTYNPALSSPLVPTVFRTVADSTDPDSIGNTAVYKSINGFSQIISGYFQSTNAKNTPVIAPFSGAWNSSTAFSPATFRLVADNTAMTFNVPATNASYFREPTLLAAPTVAGGTLRASGSRNKMIVDSTAASPSNHPDIKPFLDSYGAVTSVADNSKQMGIYISTAPSIFYDETSGTPPFSIPQGVKALWNSSATWITYRMQYQDPTGNWVTYDAKCTATGGNTRSSQAQYKVTGSNYTIDLTNGNSNQGQCTAYDPRTSRFASPLTGVLSSGQGGLEKIPDPNVNAAPFSKGWINRSEGVYGTRRPDFSSGYVLYNASQSPIIAKGWTLNVSGNPSIAQGLFSQNNSTFTSNGKTFVGGSGGIPTSQYYFDADGVVRRAMGAYFSGSTGAIGLPMATASSGFGNPTRQMQSRPVVLNRPFQSIGELGYTFSDTPWKNLDFFTPESGDSPLLDIFTINETDDPDGLIAGRVDLNTKQAPVLQAILAGAYKDEQKTYSVPPSYSTLEPLGGTSSGEPAAIATALIARTADSSAAKGPLVNVAELVGKYASGSAPNAIFNGFSQDLTTDVNGTAVFGTNNETSNIQRFREAPIRALSAAGQTRVWNLLIDVIAQTGRFSSAASGLDKFLVDGEQRYWVHVAIDRLTGKVIDKQVEVVK